MGTWPLFRKPVPSPSSTTVTRSLSRIFRTMARNQSTDSQPRSAPSLFGTYRDRYHSEYNFDIDRYVAGASGTNPDGTVNGDPFNGVVQCGVTPGVATAA